MEAFNHKKVENNWREHWFKNNIYKAVDFSEKPKKYILAELPYPSGKFLHVGHMMRYTVPEIYSRFLRMRGYNVLFPMGWDCFGLPGETFAIKEGITPQEAVTQAGKDYRVALQKMGYAFDWDREINTSDPEFYKWTQMMFIKLWEAGLAQVKEMPVWWCDELGVLADEEVLPAPNGEGKISERGSYPVEKKNFKQWVLDIPSYADRLLEDLDKTDYTDAVKQGQKNWIGRKEGINITYDVVGSDEKIVCFTTTPVNFGATFLVVAPENAIVSKIVKDEFKKEVEAYVTFVSGKSEIERMQEDKVKTGVFTGSYALNHVTNEEIPIYIADFVLNSVGTGAVQGCPAHDERDFDFAKKFNLPIVRVVKSTDGKTSKFINPETESVEIAKKGMEEQRVMVNSDFLNGMLFNDAMQKTMDYFVEKGWGERTTTYKIREQIFSRQRYWGEPIPLVYKQDGTIEKVPEDNLPVELPPMKDFLADKNGVQALERNTAWNQTVDSDGNPAKREVDTMPTWAGSNWYYIRYLDPKNDKEFASMDKMKYWLPVDKYYGDAGHTTAHLIYSRFWYKFLYDQGMVPTSEPYHFRMSGGMLLGPDHQKMSKSKGNVVNPDKVVENYGADAARMYLAFLGPYDSTFPWNENGLVACFRVIRTIYELQSRVDKKLSEIKLSTPTSKAYHKMVKNITDMMENLKVNTAVSEIMIFTNHLKTLDKIPADIMAGFAKVLAPIAPFLAEEVWQTTNGFKNWTVENTVHLQDWPTYEEELTRDSLMLIPVQINGKVRVTLEFPFSASEEEIKKVVLADPTVLKFMGNATPKKFIYIKEKIVNLVI